MPQPGAVRVICTAAFAPSRLRQPLGSGHIAKDIQVFAHEGLELLQTWLLGPEAIRPKVYGLAAGNDRPIGTRERQEDALFSRTFT
jgi:hypothetical protein